MVDRVHIVSKLLMNFRLVFGLTSYRRKWDRSVNLVTKGRRIHAQFIRREFTYRYTIFIPFQRF